jgi:biopolymer transport protein ExbB/biopolymer transport protein TolQ
MSAYSIGVMIDRVMAYSAARKQSRQFAPAVAGALREGKLDEAVKIADRYKKSHLAKVVVAGLQEFQAHQISSEIPGEEIEASKRALERAEAIVHAELKRGVSGLATIGSTAPFVGLFGTVVGIINAFKGIREQQVDRSGRGRRRYFGSAGDHRYRFVRGYPGRSGCSTTSPTRLKRSTWKWVTPVPS